MEKTGVKLKESRLRWYNHVLRRKDDIGGGVIEMKLPGGKKGR